MSSPIKPVRIGSQVFNIAGVSTTDPYFAGIGDNFEPEFDRICSDFVREGYVCMDIGANIGLKSLLLAQHVPNGRVIAIEPAPTVAALLEQNIAQSNQRNIVVVKTAVGDSNGTVRFNDASAYGHISAAGVEVPVRTLASLVDEFRLERLDFVKIDVEGYEFPILRSAIDLLNRKQSLVLFEFNSWCQIALSGVGPKEFAEWVFGHFSNIFMVRRGAGDSYLERLPADGSLHFLHTNLVHDGTVTDLLVTNFERRLTSAQNHAHTEPDSVSMARDLATTRLERDAAIAERDAALADIAALHDSTSWKVTTPLRSIGSAIRRRR